MIDGILTNKELELLLEILEVERRHLLPEIRHTDTRGMRAELQVRLRTIDRLVERFGEKLAELQRAAGEPIRGGPASPSSTAQG